MPSSGIDRKQVFPDIRYLHAVSHGSQRDGLRHYQKLLEDLNSFFLENNLVMRSVINWNGGEINVRMDIHGGHLTFRHLLIFLASRRDLTPCYRPERAFHRCCIGFAHLWKNMLMGLFQCHLGCFMTLLSWDDFVLFCIA